MTVLTDAAKKNPSSTIKMDDLYSRNPGAAQVTPTSATSSSATTKDATASTYEAQTRELGEGEMADSELNRITSQDSPLMQRAKQEGVLTAAKRGLQNSSIAAGTAQGAMVDRAMPLAQQNAQQAFQQGRANQDATNQSRAQNAELETNTSGLNATEANKTSALNAQLTTDISRFNAGLDMDASLANAAAENTMRANVMAQNADLNKQFLAGTQAMDLATIQGQFQQLISTNEMAGNLYNAYFNSIGQVMANKDMPPDRVAEMVRVQQSTLEAGLRMMELMNTMDLGGVIENLPAPQSGAGSGTGASGGPASGGSGGAGGGAAGGAGGGGMATMVKVGDAELPPGTTTKETRKGYYDVFNAEGVKIGTLSPGGKNGRYSPVNAPTGTPTPKAPTRPTRL